MAIWQSHRRCHHCGQRLDVSEAEIRPPAPDVDPDAGSSPQYLDPAARLRRTESAGNLLPDGRIPLQVPRQRPADHEKPVKLGDYQVTGPKSAPKQPQNQPAGPQPVTPQPVPGRRGSAPKLAKPAAPLGSPPAPAAADKNSGEIKSGKYRAGPAKLPAADTPAAEPVDPIPEPVPEPTEKSRTVRSYRDMNRVAVKPPASRWLVPVGLVVGFTLTLAGVLYYLLVIAKR